MSASAMNTDSSSARSSWMHGATRCGAASTPESVGSTPSARTDPLSAQARILLLCDDRRGHANTVLDHIEAFRRFSRHQVRTFNTKAMSRSLALDLDEFDVVVIHYSVVLCDPHYVAPHFREKLRRF